jgi:hypothetical protein
VCVCVCVLVCVCARARAVLILVLEGPQGPAQQDSMVAALLLERIEVGPVSLSVHIEEDGAMSIQAKDGSGTARQTVRPPPSAPLLRTRTHTTARAHVLVLSSDLALSPDPTPPICIPHLSTPTPHPYTLDCVSVFSCVLSLII